MRKKESKHAKVLRELGFKKTQRGINDSKILAVLKRFDCGMFVAFNSPPRTSVTDETGQDWDLIGKEIDLREFGIREAVSIDWSAEPEFAEGDKVTVSVIPHKVLH